VKLIDENKNNMEKNMEYMSEFLVR